MAWVTKSSEETYRQEPQAVHEYTKREKAKNWWHYHKFIVLGAILGVVFVVCIVKDTVFQTKPDLSIGYVGVQSLPSDTVTALQTALTPYIDDYNGDGQVLLQINEYTINFDAESTSTDAYYQMASMTQLSTELSDGSTCLFLLDDPAGFETDTGALQYLDGTVPEDIMDTSNENWREMVYRWADCPVLAGLELGTYTGYTILDSETGENQDVLADLYIARRGVWESDDASLFENGLALWDTLTAGAVSLQE